MKLKNLRLSTNDKVGLIKNLSTMLSAGIPILESVDSLLEDAKKNPKKLLETLKSDLNEGRHIYYTFDKFPKIFDKVTVNILKASEEAGTLDVTLQDLTENIRKENEFKDKVKSALLYPIVILVVFVVVFVVLLIVVIPKISMVFSRLNVVLPLPTKILIFTSDVVLEYTLPLIGVLGIASIGMFFLYREKKELILHFFFSLPLISQLAIEIDLTKFTRAMYLLLSAGIPITEALDLTRNIVIKRSVKKTIDEGYKNVQGGKKLSTAFKAHKHVIPSIMIKIVEAGEKSGSLDKSMEDISEYLDYQVSKTLKTLTTLIEPVMLVCVAVLIGGMMLAIIAPIYGLIGQIGNR